MPKLVWFKQDLRTHDQPALHHACLEAQDGVIALYLITPEIWQAHDDAPIKIEFWRQNLISLQSDLTELNIPLVIKTINDKNIAGAVTEVCKQYNIDKVYFNKNYEYNERQADLAVYNSIIKHNIECELFLDRCIIAPGTLLNKQNNPYTVFTPFKKSWFAEVHSELLRTYPKPKKQKALTIELQVVPEKIAGFEFDLDTTCWPIGEAMALKKLQQFIKNDIDDYKKLRDYPSQQATSRLSPYLVAGVISMKQCMIAALNHNEGNFIGSNQGAATWISELVWREFYQHIMFNFPRICMHQPFQEKTTQLKWNQDKSLFSAWKQGKTGVPIVDAAMRQLNTTGWMHNRLRMIVAMFLTKNCFIDWREGEKYFMQHLIDGDLGANNGGWQWSASTGTDAAPYFRIMNPMTQSQRFDEQGDFIRFFCPELKSLDNKTIHNPYEQAPILMQNIDYPKPSVDLKSSRAEAIERFKKL
jgi:deoxyribodipyrimidine photo-lyase